MFEHISIDDLVQLFKHTVFRYEGKPVYVSHIDQKKNLTLCDVNTRAPLVIRSISDKRFDFTPVPLGMVNESGNAFWVRRVPRRAWKQGLSGENIAVSRLPGAVSMAGWHEVNALQSEGLVNCILNIYPKIKEAMDSLAGVAPPRSVAISRHFAVSRNASLFFKEKKVGNVNAANGKPVLLKGFEPINCILEDVLNA